MEQWIFESLSYALGEELSEDLTQYILSVETEADFEDYMTDLFDFSNKDQKELYENIKAAKFGSQNCNQNIRKTKSKSGSNDSSNTKVASLTQSSLSQEILKKNMSKVKIINNELNTKSVQEPVQGSLTDSGRKKTKKFRKFQLHELQRGLLKEGRNPCECQATRHKLINNCLECGRIVCEQEGSGPCFFCDNMVATKEELEILNSDTKDSDTLYRALNERKKSEAWKKAIQSRNKLLEFDSTAAQLTKIIDDEHDYYDVNNRWNTKKEHEEIVKELEKDRTRKHASRLGTRKIVLDLLDMQVIEENSFNCGSKLEEENVEEPKYLYQPIVPSINELLESFKREKALYQENKFGIDLNNTSGNEKESNNNNKRIKSLEANDKGMCLSMHQPWASLLVLGIKKHEGRSWYTPYRGTLWIASTSKSPDPDTIKEVEDFYTSYYSGLNIKFPDKYSVGCLLGCVVVQNCLKQDEYRKQYPTGESESPYVLICSDPQQLIVPIPMKGEHKIYKMNSKIHTMAREALVFKKRFAK